MMMTHRISNIIKVSLVFTTFTRLVTGEERRNNFWLNELNVEKTSAGAFTAGVEVAARLDGSVVPQPLRANLRLDWYNEDIKIGGFHNISVARLGEWEENAEGWNGTWTGHEESLTDRSSAFTTDVVGGVRLSFDNECPRVYCWGEKATLLTQLDRFDEPVLCDTIITHDDIGALEDGARLNFALVNTDEPPTDDDADVDDSQSAPHYGRQESDFRWVKYQDKNNEMLSSLGSVNICTGGNGCDDVITQTFAAYLYHSFASGLFTSLPIVSMTSVVVCILTVI